MRAMCSIARTNLDQALSDRRELGGGERALSEGPRHACRASARTPAVWRTSRNLIGRRAVARHAIRHQLGLVQLDQVFHLPALAWTFS